MNNELYVTNGIMDLDFNPYVYEYTVLIDDNINSLEFSYNLLEGYNIDIRNNIINKDNQVIYVDIYNIDNIDTYTFYVYKENNIYSSLIDEYKKSIEVTNKEIPIYKVEILSVIIFLLIVIVFSIMFKKKYK